MNQQYKAEVSQYQKKDTIIAISLWVILMVMYGISGLGGYLFGIPYVTLTSIVLTLVCVAIVLNAIIWLVQK